MNKLVVPAVAAFALVAGSAVAADEQRGQQAQPGAQQEQLGAQQGQQAGQTAPKEGQHELIGMEVVAQDGEEIGEISNVLINDEGQVEAVILQRGTAVLGLGGDDVAVPFDQIELPQADPAIASDEQQAKLKMTEEQFGELPDFESTRAEAQENEGQAQPGATGTQPGTTGTQPTGTGTTGTQPGGTGQQR